jgi:tetratricopeptide (TPR) repeat protein
MDARSGAATASSALASAPTGTRMVAGETGSMGGRARAVRPPDPAASTGCGARSAPGGRRRCRVALCLAVLLVLPVHELRAENQPDAADEVPAAGERPAAEARARRQFARGERLYSLGRFREALAAYRAAYRALPMPAFVFNLAQCYRNLGDRGRAIALYRRYLVLDPEAEDRAEIEHTIEELERAEAREAERDRSAALLASAGSERSRPEDRSSSLWWWGGAAAAVGVVTAAVLLWPRGGPESDLGTVELPLGGP